MITLMCRTGFLRMSLGPQSQAKPFLPQAIPCIISVWTLLTTMERICLSFCIGLWLSEASGAAPFQTPPASTAAGQATEQPGELLPHRPWWSWLEDTGDRCVGGGLACSWGLPLAAEPPPWCTVLAGVVEAAACNGYSLYKQAAISGVSGSNMSCGKL